VAVQDVGLAVRLEEELEGGLAEEIEADLVVVPLVLFLGGGGEWGGGWGGRIRVRCFKGSDQTLIVPNPQPSKAERLSRFSPQQTQQAAHRP
jgi:hypothetical protein